MVNDDKNAHRRIQTQHTCTNTYTRPPTQLAPNTHTHAHILKQTYSKADGAKGLKSYGGVTIIHTHTLARTHMRAHTPEIECESNRQHNAQIQTAHIHAHTHTRTHSRARAHAHTPEDRVRLHNGPAVTSPREVEMSLCVHAYTKL